MAKAKRMYSWFLPLQVRHGENLFRKRWFSVKGMNLSDRQGACFEFILFRSGFQNVFPSPEIGRLTSIRWCQKASKRGIRRKFGDRNFCSSEASCWRLKRLSLALWMCFVEGHFYQHGMLCCPQFAWNTRVTQSSYPETISTLVIQVAPSPTWLQTTSFPSLLATWSFHHGTYYYTTRLLNSYFYWGYSHTYCHCSSYPMCTFLTCSPKSRNIAASKPRSGRKAAVFVLWKVNKRTKQEIG